MMPRDSLLTRHAQQALSSGDFQTALQLYTELRKQISPQAYNYNILVCAREILNKTPPHCGSNTAALIELASFLSTRKQDSPIPIEGRIALVSSHRWRKQKIGYGRRVQQMAKHFQANGKEVYFITRHLGTASNDINKEQEIRKDGVVYFYNECQTNDPSRSIEKALPDSIDSFSKWFIQFRPQIIIAPGDFTSALPAIVAARRLSIPVIKEHLCFAEIFNEAHPCAFFNALSFTQKLAVEEACVRLADASYYLYPNAPASWASLEHLIGQLTSKQPQEHPLATIEKGGSYLLTLPIENPGLHFLEISCTDTKSANPKGIVASFRTLGQEGLPAEAVLPNIASSKLFPQYQYCETDATAGNFRVLVLEVPEGITKIEIDLVAFNTNGDVAIHYANTDRVCPIAIARWLSLKAAGVDWIQRIEGYIHKEGEQSLRIALLNYKYHLTGNQNDKTKLENAVQEMVELDREWVPELRYSAKTLQIKDTGKVTVAHLHKTSYPYENTGGSIRCLNTVVSQKRIGIDPYIITPIGYPPKSDVIQNSKNHEIIEGVDNFRIGTNTKGASCLSLSDQVSFSVFYIAKLIRDRGANIIHAASGFRGYELALQGIALKRLTGLPLIYEVRSFHEHTWTKARNDVLELEKTQLRMIKENFCMEQSDLVVTISTNMKDVLTNRGIPSRKIEVVPNAIDETQYTDKPILPIHIPELMGADLVVGYISNMSLREGHYYLIRAIHKIRKRTNRDIRGLLVGTGSERINLEALSAELGIREKIVFTGEIDHKNIKSYYKAIDIFVIPRIPDYAADWVTPLKPYEAMALELPIIVTDLPALKEIIGNNQERGLLAKSGDVDSLVEQLIRYIENPTLRHSKAKAGREWVFAERTWGSNAHKYAALYRRILDHRSIIKKSYT